MRKLLPLLLALMLTAMSVSAVSAHFISTGVIDTDNDQKFDLDICFGVSGQSLYSQRGSYSGFIYAQISDYVVGDTSVGGVVYNRGWRSMGACNNDGSNVQLVMVSSLGSSCATYAEVQKLDGGPVDPNGGYASLRVAINNNCPWDYNPSDGTPASQLSLASVVAHELIHFWGLNGHLADPYALMHDGGPVNCSLWGNSPTARTADVAFVRNRYSGLSDTSTAPANACLW